MMNQFRSCARRSLVLVIAMIAASVAAAQNLARMREVVLVGPNYGYPPRVLDFDADGDLDVLIEWRGGFDLFLNDGAEGYSVSSLVDPGLPQIQPTGFAAGDVDGDGDLDVLLGFSSSGTYLVEIQSNGIQSVRQVDSNGIRCAVFEDIDRDGDLDVIFGVPALAVAFNDGTGNFSSQPGMAPAGNAERLILADLNGDGRRDLVIDSGQRAFQTALWTPTGFVSSASAAKKVVCVGDFDVDGDTDVVVAGGWLELMLNDGRGGFAPGRPVFNSNNPSACEAVDLDGDGDPDLAISGREHMRALTIALNDGRGNFFDGTGSWITTRSDRAFNVATGDFDGDGDIDVATEGRIAGKSATVWINRSLDLRAPRTVFRGATWDIEIARDAGVARDPQLGFIAMGSERSAPLPHPFGNLRLDAGAQTLPFVSLPQGFGSGVLSLPVPTSPQLLGLTVATQGLTFSLAAAANPRLTALQRTTVR